MRTYVIVDRGPDRDAHGDRFHVSQYAADASSHSSSGELHLSTYLMSYIPSRHLVEELAKRVNCYVVVDDQPDPLTVDQPAAACACELPGEYARPIPGIDHERACRLYSTGPM